MLRFFSFLLFISLYTTAIAQSIGEPVFPVKDLSIHWEAMQNDFPGLIIRYTLDGKDPNAQSNMYKEPVSDKGKGIKFRAFDTKGRG